MKLTKLPSDILRLIGLNLNPINLRSFRLTCKTINTVYKKDVFWTNKTKLDYPNQFKNKEDNTDWLEYYIHLYGGKLFTFGNNKFGQLGDGTNVNRNIPTEIKLLRNKVKSVSCGSYHTIVVTKDGKLFSFGNNKDGQLGDGTSVHRPRSTKIKLLKDSVKSVSCGDYYTVVVTKDGKLYGFGDNYHGQLGDGTNESKWDPTEIKLLRNNVKSVSCGSDHTSVITKGGKLYTFAYNMYGQLGDGDNVNRNVPDEIKFESNVKSVSCGDCHTVVVTKDGKLYSFGNNLYGQLGDGTNVNKWTPTEIKLFENNVKSVSCGGYHTIVVTKDGKLFSFGNNRFGQLGDGTGVNRNIPTEIELLRNDVKSVSCGDCHTVVVTKDGRLFSFGDNRFGQLGDGTNEDKWIPTEIKLFENNVRSVSCGYFYTSVVTN